MVHAIAIGVCACALLGSAPKSVEITVTPGNPAAGDTIAVTVNSSASWPVTVTIQIDSMTVVTQSVGGPGGGPSWVTAAGDRGKSWKVEASEAGGCRTGKNGVL